MFALLNINMIKLICRRMDDVWWWECVICDVRRHPETVWRR